MKFFSIERKDVAWKAVGNAMVACNYRNVVKICGVPVYTGPEKRVMDYIPTERKRKSVWVKI